MLNISIVIPAYNEEKNIGRLLSYLQKLPQTNILEILVVDNGSFDKTREIVNAIIQNPDGSGQKIRLIEESRKGCSWARSRGADEARGEIIAFLDADGYVTDRWLKKMLSIFSSEKVVGASSPTYYYDLPWLTRTVAHIYWWFASIFVSKIVGYMGNFANMAVRAESFRKIGGIDTSIEFFGDDTNLSHRLSEVGKFVFSFGFFNYGSGRRFKEHGLLLTTWRYSFTYFYEVFFHKIPTKDMLQYNRDHVWKESKE